MNQLNCKPGDQAMIVAAPKYPHLVGMEVSVLRRRPTERFQAPDGSWIGADRPDSEVRWLIQFKAPVVLQKRSGMPYVSAYSAANDRYLLPIRPEPDPLEVTRETEVTA